MILSLSLLGIGIAAYSISQLQQQGKLKWSRSNPVWGFWSGAKSWTRKYKLDSSSMLITAPDNWYYRFFKIKYKERFLLSATFLVSLTDGYHLTQSISFLSFAGAFSLLSGIHFLYVWAGILLIHFTTYRLLQR